MKISRLATLALAIGAIALASCSKDDSKIPPPPHQGVEINGVTWAEFNVAAPGTFAATAEATGMYYQWNKKIGWSATDPMTDSNGGTTWDYTPATGDTWAAENDPCPAGWHVPTKDEMATLFEIGNVDIVWTTSEGVNGCRFTDKTSNKSIFFPAAGCRFFGGALDGVGNYTATWASSVDLYNTAWGMSLESTNLFPGAAYIVGGESVRCVK